MFSRAFMLRPRSNLRVFTSFEALGCSLDTRFIEFYVPWPSFRVSGRPAREASEALRGALEPKMAWERLFGGV